MAKITIDTKGLITSEEDIQRAHQVATKTYLLLQDAGHFCEEMVEIIKVTTWTETLYNPDRKRHEEVHFAAFQLVCNLSPSFFSSKGEKLRVVVDWDSRKPEEMWLRRPSGEGHTAQICLESTSPEALAKGLIKAIQLRFLHHLSRLEELKKWLAGRVAILAGSSQPVTEPLAET